MVVTGDSVASSMPKCMSTSEIFVAGKNWQIQPVFNMFSFIQPRSHAVVRVPRMTLNGLQLFERKPELISAGRYEITSDVDPDVVDLLFERIAGDTGEVVTRDNVDQLRTLCDELGFSGFDSEFRTVLGSDVKVQKDLACMRSRADRHDIHLEQLQLRVAMLERQLQDQGEMLQRIESLERQLAEIRRSNLAGAIADVRSETNGLNKDVQWLRSEIGQLKRTTAKRPTKVLRSTPEGIRVVTERQEFVYSEGNELDGIIAHLTLKTVETSTTRV